MVFSKLSCLFLIQGETCSPGSHGNAGICREGLARWRCWINWSSYNKSRQWTFPTSFCFTGWYSFWQLKYYMSFCTLWMLSKLTKHNSWDMQIYKRLVDIMSLPPTDAQAAAVGALYNLTEINMDSRLKLASERWWEKLFDLLIGHILRLLSIWMTYSPHITSGQLIDCWKWLRHHIQHQKFAGKQQLFWKASCWSHRTSPSYWCMKMLLQRCSLGMQDTRTYLQGYYMN